MNSLKDRLLISFLCALALLATVVPNHAYAYIDPGTGSQVLQILAAGALTALFFIKTIWRTVAAKISSLFGKKNHDK